MTNLFEIEDKVRITYNEESKTYDLLVISGPTTPKITGVGLCTLSNEEYDKMFEKLSEHLFR